MSWPGPLSLSGWRAARRRGAVIEDLGLKQRIFADLERVCNPNCILSTNTSTIDITTAGAPPPYPNPTNE